MKHAVLITRPAHQVQHLSQLITATGATVFHLPVFDIQSLPFSPINPDQFDYFIFLSANAVFNFFSRVDKNNFLTLNMIAIGSATKRALNDIGMTNILCPNQFSSDAILQMPELQHVATKNIVIICGETPKPLLQKILSERGALIHEIFCYRRQNCVYDMGDIFSQLIANQIDVVVCASAKSLLQLVALFTAPTHHAWLLQKTLCVINESMKNIAIKMGFHSIIVAENATDEAVSFAVTGQQFLMNIGISIFGRS